MEEVIYILKVYFASFISECILILSLLGRCDSIILCQYFRILLFGWGQLLSAMLDEVSALALWVCKLVNTPRARQSMLYSSFRHLIRKSSTRGFLAKPPTVDLKPCL